MKLLVAQHSAHPSFLVSLKPKYVPQHPQCERPSFTPIQNNEQNYVSVYLKRIFGQQTEWQKILHRKIADIPSLQSSLNFLLNGILIHQDCSQIFGLFHRFTGTLVEVIIIIIIIFINCSWVVTRWQWLIYMCTKQSLAGETGGKETTEETQAQMGG